MHRMAPKETAKKENKLPCVCALRFFVRCHQESKISEDGTTLSSVCHLSCTRPSLPKIFCFFLRHINYFVSLRAKCLCSTISAVGSINTVVSVASDCSRWLTEDEPYVVSVSVLLPPEAASATSKSVAAGHSRPNLST